MLVGEEVCNVNEHWAIDSHQASIFNFQATQREDPSLCVQEQHFPQQSNEQQANWCLLWS